MSQQKAKHVLETKRKHTEKHKHAKNQTQQNDLHVFFSCHFQVVFMFPMSIVRLRFTRISKHPKCCLWFVYSLNEFRSVGSTFGVIALKFIRQTIFVGELGNNMNH